MANERKGAREDADFGWTRLEPAEPEHLLAEDSFSVFLVDVKSESETGQWLLNDPLTLFRDKIPEMGIRDPGVVRAQVLRVNAEVPANPVRRREVWMVYPGSTTAVGVQYKYMKDET
jgi:hypothetical protein